MIKKRFYLNSKEIYLEKLGKRGKQVKKIGLVLAGGGGKGAYHIGVWKALRETGLDQFVTSVSGTSVGGLNAALFLQGDYEQAEEIWKNISVEKILTPKSFSYPLQENDGMVYAFLRTGLLEIMDQHLDMSVFDNSNRNCYITCVRTLFQKDNDSYLEMLSRGDGTKEFKKYINGKAIYFNMRSFSYEDRKKILLATSAIPFLFPKEKIGDYYYMDGSMVDNLPVEPLYRLEKCEIIVVVHLGLNYGYIEYKKFPDARILEIRPKHDLGGVFAGTLDFKAENAIQRIQQGYDDTIELFQEIEKSYRREKDSLLQWKTMQVRETSALKKIAKERMELQKRLME